MTGQFVVESLRLCIGYVEAHPVWTFLYLLIAGVPFLRIGGKSS